MKNQPQLFALLLAAGLVVGCGEETQESPAPAVEESASSVSEQAGDAFETIKDQAAEAEDKVKDAGAEVVESANDALGSLVDQGFEALEDAKPGETITVKIDEQQLEALAADGKIDGGALRGSYGSSSYSSEQEAGDGAALSLESITAGMSLSSDQADGIIAQIKSLISEKNFDTAQQWISKLEGVNLPEGYGEQVSNLKGLLEKAQGASQLLDGFGGIGK